HLEVVHRHDLAVLAGSDEGGLVDQIRQVGAGKARRAARDDVQLHVVAERDLLGVHREDLLATAYVRQIDDHAPIESARTQQRRIEYVGTVRRGDEDDALVALEAVHLDEQLVERLLALVVPTAEPRATMPADG